ncbi:hypothetical protein VTJ83DRAFT_2044 [Remersonia thermophila]|uniref:Transposase n=1 Tax=Remersonia thermophila TaxID=72144 RepID=A0ABR4DHN8_9PEZI
MTGKQLNEEQRALLARCFQVKKLTNADISFILNISIKTVQRRRIEYQETGLLKPHKDVSKNAEKLKPHHLEKLVEWHQSHPDALLEDMQLFLRVHCGLELSTSTISRQLRKAIGVDSRLSGTKARVKSRRRREAEGRSLAAEIRQEVAAFNGGSGAGASADGNRCSSSSSSSSSSPGASGGGGNRAQPVAGQQQEPEQQQGVLPPLPRLLTARDGEPVCRQGHGQQTAARRGYTIECFAPPDGSGPVRQGGRQQASHPASDPQEHAHAAAGHNPR